MRVAQSFACIAATLFLIACAEPPHKEMDQAQGALDAARAAGAERYAADAYNAATLALKNSNEAATTGDYRLALNNALESLEQALTAARVAADTKAQMRGEVERDMADIATLLSLANAGRAAATRARVTARALAEPAAAIETATAQVQKAGEAIEGDDYFAARTALDGIKASLEKAVADIDAAVVARTRRR
jgi:hypothetical protein